MNVYIYIYTKAHQTCDATLDNVPAGTDSPLDAEGKTGCNTTWLEDSGTTTSSWREFGGEVNKIHSKCHNSYA